MLPCLLDLGGHAAGADWHLVGQFGARNDVHDLRGRGQRAFLRDLFKP